MHHARKVKALTALEQDGRRWSRFTLCRLLLPKEQRGQRITPQTVALGPRFWRSLSDTLRPVRPGQKAKYTGNTFINL